MARIQFALAGSAWCDELAANVTTAGELAPILEAIITHAVRLIDDVDVADILLIDEDGHHWLAPTARIAMELDACRSPAPAGEVGAAIQAGGVSSPGGAGSR